MNRLLLLLLLPLYVPAQQADFITVRKKNGRSLKTIMPGAPIHLRTAGGMPVEGTVNAIRNDSIWITTYDIRTGVSVWGTNVVDTVARHLVRLHHREIGSVKVFHRPRFIRGKLDKLLRIGGAGYFTLNVLNRTIEGSSLTSGRNAYRLGLATAAFGAGWLIRKFAPVNRYSRRWHRIEYVRL
ncbi:MAG TPA: hypothetical protein VHK69_07595 [Chitinophagaceae bacterium]|jgi:hypothetical protein|nr:hypothetical protein [Chitinophagaceae bacterium]